LGTHSQPIYAFMHLYRCAGSSIRRWIIESAAEGADQYAAISDQGARTWISLSHDFYHQPDKIIEELGKLSPERRENVKVVFGHYVIAGLEELFDREVKYITFVRDPIERLVSLYNLLLNSRKDGPQIQWGMKSEDGQLVDINTWASTFAANSMTRFFCARLKQENMKDFQRPVSLSEADEVCDFLSNFQFIGLHDNLDEDLVTLQSLLGFDSDIPHTNAAKKTSHVERNTMDELAAANDLDFRIYEHCLKLRA